MAAGAFFLLPLNVVAQRFVQYRLELAPLAAALQTEQARVADALGAMSRLQAQATSQQGREAQPLLALPAPGTREPELALAASA